MGKSKTLIAVLLLLMGGFAVGQSESSEIKQQTLHYGEYVSQICLQHNISSSWDFYQTRDDCAGKLTVRDLRGRLVIQNRDMLFLSDGTYGYLATPVQFNTLTQYRATVNFSLPGGQSGEVTSMFTVLNDTEEESATADEGDGSLISNLRNLKFNIDFSGVAAGVVKGIKDFAYGNPLLKMLYEIGSGFNDVVKELWTIIKTGIGIMVGLITDPIGKLTGFIIPGIIDLFLGLAVVYLLYCVLFEAVMIGYAFIRHPDGDVFAIVSEWFMLHVRLVIFVFQAFYQVIMLGVSLITVALKGVSTIRQIFQI